MNIKVGSIFPENSIYFYNEGIMKKAITTSLFSKKKGYCYWNARSLHTNLL